MVAPARLKAWAWPSAATLAAGFIALLAFQGERPEPGLVRFAPAGLLADRPIQDVTSVEISAPNYKRSFQRDPRGGWRSSAADTAIDGDLVKSLETGLKLLHNSAPQRTDLAIDQLDEFGLKPARLTVTVRAKSGDAVTVEFGGANPLRLERYARIAGRSEVLLLPAFVADAWEQIAARR